MLHGQPSEGKSWAALEIGVSLAVGNDCAFGLQRLRSGEPMTVYIVGNEDREKATFGRLQSILAGRGVFEVPSNIHLLVDKSCDLDQREWQTLLIREGKQLGVSVFVLDPLRSLTACVDQGPHELQPFARFLRRLIRETGAAVLLVHHDTKPVAGLIDRRRRAQRASGGAIFSIVDAPIHVERVDQRRSLVAPDGFKFSADDPASFVFERTGDGPMIRLVATETGGASSPADVSLQGKVLGFLRENPRQSGRAIAEAVEANRQDVSDVLESMRTAGLVDFVKGIRRALLWSVR
jgi:hypothetical protein